MIALIVILSFAAIVLLPFLMLWMLDVLFDLGYEYTMPEWFASLLLCLIVVGVIGL